MNNDSVEEFVLTRNPDTKAIQIHSPVRGHTACQSFCNGQSCAGSFCSTFFALDFVIHRYQSLTNSEWTAVPPQNCTEFGVVYYKMSCGTFSSIPDFEMQDRSKLTPKNIKSRQAWCQGWYYLWRSERVFALNFQVMQGLRARPFCWNSGWTFFCTYNLGCPTRPGKLGPLCIHYNMAGSLQNGSRSHGPLHEGKVQPPIPSGTYSCNYHAGLWIPCFGFDLQIIIQNAMPDKTPQILIDWDMWPFFL